MCIVTKSSIIALLLMMIRRFLFCYGLVLHTYRWQLDHHCEYSTHVKPGQHASDASLHHPTHLARQTVCGAPLAIQ